MKKSIFILSIGVMVLLAQAVSAQWVKTNPGLNFMPSAFAISDSFIYVGGNGIYRSPYNGVSWTNISGTAPVLSLAVNGNTLFVGTTNGVYRSTNNGTSWSSMKNTFYDSTVLAIAILNGSTVFAGTSRNDGTGRIFRSTDNGLNWTVVFTGGEIKSLAVSGGNILAGVSSGGVLLSTDTGTTWALTSTAYSYVVASGGRIFANALGGGLCFSSDNGITWTVLNKTFPAGFTAYCKAANGPNVFQGGSPNGVLLSTNNGQANWIAINFGLPYLTLSYPSVICLAANNSYIFLGFQGTDVYSSPYGVWYRPLSDLTIPSTPILLSPSVNSTQIATNPTLIWRAETNVISYSLQVSTDSINFTSPVVNQSGLKTPSFGVTGLGINTKYYWRVCATNDIGISAWSSVWSFTTVTPPAPPILSSPSNGSFVSLNPTLNWKASTGANSYSLQVSLDSNFSTTVYNQNGITSLSQQVTGLSNNIRYFWRVNASDIIETSAWSYVWSFNTPTVPTTPTLVGPANGQTGCGTNLYPVWNKANRAVSYRVQVSPDSNFIITIRDTSGIKDTVLNLNGLAENTKYYWRVNAINGIGTSLWSSVWSFTTRIPAPIIVSPSNGAVGISINPVLLWNKVIGTALYRVQVSTDQNFSSTSKDSSGISDTSLTLSDLINNTMYYWRVNATNSGYTSSWATAWSFTTAIAAGTISSHLPNIKSFSCTNTAGALRYALPKSCFVSIKYYDLQGRMVRSFVNATQQSGYYTLKSPTESLTPNVYIQEFIAGTFVKKERLSVVR